MNEEPVEEMDDTKELALSIIFSILGIAIVILSLAYGAGERMKAMEKRIQNLENHQTN